jgi:hypothetical protein
MRSSDPMCSAALPRSQRRRAASEAMSTNTKNGETCRLIAPENAQYSGRVDTGPHTPEVFLHEEPAVFAVEGITAVAATGHVDQANVPRIPQLEEPTAGLGLRRPFRRSNGMKSGSDQVGSATITERTFAAPHSWVSGPNSRVPLTM